MFDYSIHKIFCPLCKRIREEFAKSSGTNYYIKGHGENIYYKDTCSLCEKSYYLIAGNEGFIKSRLEGIAMEDALKNKINELEKSFRLFYGIEKHHELWKSKVKCVTEICKRIYGMDENELVIPAELVNKDDLIVESVWMS